MWVVLPIFDQLQEKSRSLPSFENYLRDGNSHVVHSWGSPWFRIDRLHLWRAPKTSDPQITWNFHVFPIARVRSNNFIPFHSAARTRPLKYSELPRLLTGLTMNEQPIPSETLDQLAGHLIACDAHLGLHRQLGTPLSSVASGCTRVRGQGCAHLPGRRTRCPLSWTTSPTKCSWPTLIVHGQAWGCSTTSSAPCFLGRSSFWKLYVLVSYL